MVGLESRRYELCDHSQKTGKIMLHHLSIAVTDLERAAAFYDAVLTPLGYVRVFTGDESVGYGYSGPSRNMSIDFTRPRCCMEDAATGGPGYVLIMATVTMRLSCSIQMDTGLRRWLTKDHNAGFQPGTKSKRVASGGPFSKTMVF
jgi:hypothetical protein